MPWPVSQDYNEALQNPQTSFSDPELRQGQVVTNALGIPQPCSGNFADVYAVECPATGTKWAVKCFTREVRGLHDRYSEISKFLAQARLPFTVDFQYLDEGIRMAGRWYPVLKMHWVEGFTLNAFVRTMLDKPAMLDGLGRIWVRMAARLREANLGHCDLQHGNVLLVPGTTAASLAVKLIDYDGMWVPALAGTPSGEIGHPAYQHPQLFADESLGKRVKGRIDYQVNFNWGQGGPDEKVPADHFSIRWEGWLVPPRGGRYTLTVIPDDSFHLFVDEQSVMEFHNMVARHSKVLELTAKPHRIRLEYNEVVGDANIRLLWSLEGGFPEQVIPLEALYHDSQQERLLAP